MIFKPYIFPFILYYYFQGLRPSRVIFFYLWENKITEKLVVVVRFHVILREDQVLGRTLDLEGGKL